MGNLNIADVAQRVHEQIIAESGVLTVQNHLRFDQPLPNGPQYVGVYLDDLLLVHKSLTAQLARGVMPNGSAINRIESSYAVVGLDRSPGKGFRNQTDFKAWGAEVSGRVGTIASPLSYRVELCRIIMLTLSLGSVTKKLVEEMLGVIVAALSLRREFLCLLHRVYKWNPPHQYNVWYRTPADISDELFTLGLHLPLAVADLRAPVGSTLLATDATPTAGGATKTELPENIAHMLYRRTEIRGAHLRLHHSDPDWGQDSQVARLSPRCSQIDALITSLDWVVQSSYSFRETSHIKLQEMRAMAREIKTLSVRLLRDHLLALTKGDSTTAGVASASCPRQCCLCGSFGQR